MHATNSLYQQELGESNLSHHAFHGFIVLDLCADLCDVKYCSSCNFSFGFRTDISFLALTILRYHSLVGLVMPFNVPRKSECSLENGL